MLNSIGFGKTKYFPGFFLQFSGQSLKFQSEILPTYVVILCKHNSPIVI